jgi:hypothetical protein
MYRYIRCTYGNFSREITIHTVIYVVLARTIYIRCIYGKIWQGNHQIYGHIRCIYTVLANPIYTVYLRYFWQGNYHTYGHIRCVYTVLANPTYTVQIYSSGQP